MYRYVNKLIIILIVILVNITIKISYADNKISLIKITGKVEISADSKTWKLVKNTQKN